MTDIPEIKSHLMNVHDSLNFLKKIDVPVDRFNKDIKGIMTLIKGGDPDEANRSVLELRKEISEIMSRMENINSGLVEMEKEIAALAKRGINTVSLRRLYSQCRLALKERDYDQVQLFIIKMEKIIDMYSFLSGETILVDVQKGEEMVDVVTKLVLEAVRKERSGSFEKEDASGKGGPIGSYGKGEDGGQGEDEGEEEEESGRYAQNEEDLPVLTPIYEDMDEDVPINIYDEKEEVFHDESDGLQIGTFGPEGTDTTRPIIRVIQSSPRDNDRGIPEESVSDDGASTDPVPILRVACDRAELDEDKQEEPEDSLERLKEVLSKMESVDPDIQRGIGVLEKLIWSGDVEGAKELAAELNRLLDMHRHKTALESLNELHREARMAMIELTGGREAPRDIRRLYDRAKLLRERGDYWISSRLFKEVTIMCRDRTEHARTEKLVKALDELRAASVVFAAHLSDPEYISFRLTELSSLIESGRHEDAENAIRMIRSSMDEADALYWKEAASSLQEILMKRNIESFGDDVKERLRGMLRSAGELGERDRWEDAHGLLVRCRTEMDREVRVGEYDGRIRAFRRELTFLPEDGSLRMRVEKLVDEAGNRLLFKDTDGFLSLFRRAEELATEEMAKGRAASNLELFRRRLKDLPEGRAKDSYMDRYYEAKSKNDDGRYEESVEISTADLNEITVKALEDIRNG